MGRPSSFIRTFPNPTVSCWDIRSIRSLAKYWHGACSTPDRREGK
jgi:hypothetical protein